MGGDVARLVVVLAACFAVATAVCLAGLLVLMPVGLGLTALLPWWLGRMHAESPQQPQRLGRWWPLACVVGAYLVIPTLMFGRDAWTVQTVGILAVVFGLVAGLASAPSAPTRAALRGGAPASWPCRPSPP